MDPENVARDLIKIGEHITAMADVARQVAMVQQCYRELHIQPV